MNQNASYLEKFQSLLALQIGKARWRHCQDLSTLAEDGVERSPCSDSTSAPHLDPSLQAGESPPPEKRLNYMRFPRSPEKTSELENGSRCLQGDSAPARSLSRHASPILVVPETEITADSVVDNSSIPVAATSSKEEEVAGKSPRKRKAHSTLPTCDGDCASGSPQKIFIVALAERVKDQVDAGPLSDLWVDDNKITNPQSDRWMDDNEITSPQSDHWVANNEITSPQSDHWVDDNEITSPQSDHWVANNEITSPQSDHWVDDNEITSPQSDHWVDDNEITSPQSDHWVDDNEITSPQSDHWVNDELVLEEEIKDIQNEAGLLVNPNKEQSAVACGNKLSLDFQNAQKLNVTCEGGRCGVTTDTDITGYGIISNRTGHCSITDSKKHNINDSNEHLVDANEHSNITTSNKLESHDAGNGPESHDAGNGRVSRDAGNGRMSHDAGMKRGSHDAGMKHENHNAGNGRVSHDAESGNDFKSSYPAPLDTKSAETKKRCQTEIFQLNERCFWFPIETNCSTREAEITDFIRPGEGCQKVISAKVQLDFKNGSNDSLTTNTTKGFLPVGRKENYQDEKNINDGYSLEERRKQSGGDEMSATILRCPLAKASTGRQPVTEKCQKATGNAKRYQLQCTAQDDVCEKQEQCPSLDSNKNCQHIKTEQASSNSENRQIVARSPDENDNVKSSANCQMHKLETGDPAWKRRGISRREEGGEAVMDTAAGGDCEEYDCDFIHRLLTPVKLRPQHLQLSLYDELQQAEKRQQEEEQVPSVVDHRTVTQSADKVMGCASSEITAQQSEDGDRSFVQIQQYPSSFDTNKLARDSDLFLACHDMTNTVHQTLKRSRLPESRETTAVPLSAHVWHCAHALKAGGGQRNNETIYPEISSSHAAGDETDNPDTEHCENTAKKRRVSTDCAEGESNSSGQTVSRESSVQVTQFQPVRDSKMPGADCSSLYHTLQPGLSDTCLYFHIDQVVLAERVADAIERYDDLTLQPAANVSGSLETFNADVKLRDISSPTNAKENEMIADKTSRLPLNLQNKMINDDEDRRGNILETWSPFFGSALDNSLINPFSYKNIHPSDEQLIHCLLTLNNNSLPSPRKGSSPKHQNSHKPGNSYNSQQDEDYLLEYSYTHKNKHPAQKYQKHIPKKYPKYPAEDLDANVATIRSIGRHPQDCKCMQSDCLCRRGDMLHDHVMQNLHVLKHFASEDPRDLSNFTIKIKEAVGTKAKDLIESQRALAEGTYHPSQFAQPSTAQLQQAGVSERKIVSPGHKKKAESPQRPATSVPMLDRATGTEGASELEQQMGSLSPRETESKLLTQTRSLLYGRSLREAISDAWHKRGKSKTEDVPSATQLKPPNHTQQSVRSPGETYTPRASYHVTKEGQRTSSYAEGRRPTGYAHPGEGKRPNGYSGDFGQDEEQHRRMDPAQAMRMEKDRQRQRQERRDVDRQGSGVLSVSYDSPMGYLEQPANAYYLSVEVPKIAPVRKYSPPAKSCFRQLSPPIRPYLRHRAKGKNLSTETKRILTTVGQNVVTQEMERRQYNPASNQTTAYFYSLTQEGGPQSKSFGGQIATTNNITEYIPSGSDDLFLSQMLKNDSHAQTSASLSKFDTSPSSCTQLSVSSASSFLTSADFGNNAIIAERINPRAFLYCSSNRSQTEIKDCFYKFAASKSSSRVFQSPTGSVISVTDIGQENKAVFALCTNGKRSVPINRGVKKNQPISRHKWPQIKGSDGQTSPQARSVLPREVRLSQIGDTARGSGLQMPRDDQGEKAETRLSGATANTNPNSTLRARQSVHRPVACRSPSPAYSVASKASGGFFLTSVPDKSPLAKSTSPEKKGDVSPGTSHKETSTTGLNEETFIAHQSSPAKKRPNDSCQKSALKKSPSPSKLSKSSPASSHFLTPSPSRPQGDKSRTSKSPRFQSKTPQKASKSSPSSAGSRPKQSFQSSLSPVSSSQPLQTSPHHKRKEPKLENTSLSPQSAKPTAAINRLCSGRAKTIQSTLTTNLTKMPQTSKLPRAVSGSPPRVMKTPSPSSKQREFSSKQQSSFTTSAKRNQRTPSRSPIKQKNQSASSSASPGGLFATAAAPKSQTINHPSAGLISPERIANVCFVSAASPLRPNLYSHSSELIINESALSSPNRKRRNFSRSPVHLSFSPSSETSGDHGSPGSHSQRTSPTFPDDQAFDAFGSNLLLQPPYTSNDDRCSTFVLTNSPPKTRQSAMLSSNSSENSKRSTYLTTNSSENRKSKSPTRLTFNAPKITKYTEGSILKTPESNRHSKCLEPVDEQVIKNKVGASITHTSGKTPILVRSSCELTVTVCKPDSTTQTIKSICSSGVATRDAPPGTVTTTQSSVIKTCLLPFTFRTEKKPISKAVAIPVESTLSKIMKSVKSMKPFSHSEEKSDVVSVKEEVVETPSVEELPDIYYDNLCDMFKKCLLRIASFFSFRLPSLPSLPQFPPPSPESPPAKKPLVPPPRPPSDSIFSRFLAAFALWLSSWTMLSFPRFPGGLLANCMQAVSRSLQPYSGVARQGLMTVLMSVAAAIYLYSCECCVSAEAKHVLLIWEQLVEDFIRHLGLKYVAQPPI